MVENRFVCICCKRRKGRGEAYIAEKYIGICRSCESKLERIAPGAVFKGNDDINSLFSVFYYKGLIRNALMNYKFFGQWRYGKIFTMLMYDYLKDLHLEDNFDLVTMVPISRKRFLERGYNQTEFLAEPLADMLGIPFDGNCIFKKRHNKTQSSVGRIAQRYENVRDAYLADVKKVKGRNILLVDDVFTSGATMKSCAKELVEKGAKSVVGITLAKTVNKHV